MSVIAAMTVNGILDVQLEHGSVNGDTFLEFKRKCVLPHLMPFIVTVSLYSIIVLYTI